jgi:hypothetical protein
VKTASDQTVLGADAPIGAKSLPPRGLDAAPARIKAVKWWAALGVAYCALAAYCWIRWLTAPEFGSTPHGPDHFGGWKLVWLRFIEIGGGPATPSLVLRAQ